MSVCVVCGVELTCSCVVVLFCVVVSIPTFCGQLYLLVGSLCFIELCCVFGVSLPCIFSPFYVPASFAV